MPLARGLHLALRDGLADASHQAEARIFVIADNRFSTTMRCVLDVALLFLIVHACVLWRVTVRRFGGRPPKWLDALSLSSLALRDAPVVALLFLTCRFRALELTGGEGSPQRWVQLAMQVAVACIVARVCSEALYALASGDLPDCPHARSAAGLGDDLASARGALERGDGAERQPLRATAEAAAEAAAQKDLRGDLRGDPRASPPSRTPYLAILLWYGRGLLGALEAVAVTALCVGVVSMEAPAAIPVRALHNVASPEFGLSDAQAEHSLGDAAAAALRLGGAEKKRKAQMYAQAVPSSQSMSVTIATLMTLLLAYFFVQVVLGTGQLHATLRGEQASAAARKAWSSARPAAALGILVLVWHLTRLGLEARDVPRMARVAGPDVPHLLRFDAAAPALAALGIVIQCGVALRQAFAEPETDPDNGELRDPVHPTGAFRLVSRAGALCASVSAVALAALVARFLAVDNSICAADGSSDGLAGIEQSVDRAMPAGGASLAVGSVASLPLWPPPPSLAAQSSSSVSAAAGRAQRPTTTVLIPTAAVTAVERLPGPLPPSQDSVKFWSPCAAAGSQLLFAAVVLLALTWLADVAARRLSGMAARDERLGRSEADPRLLRLAPMLALLFLAARLWHNETHAREPWRFQQIAMLVCACGVAFNTIIAYFAERAHGKDGSASSGDDAAVRRSKRHDPISELSSVAALTLTCGCVGMVLFGIFF